MKSAVLDVSNFENLQLDMTDQEKMLIDFLREIVKEKDAVLLSNASGCSRFETNKDLLERRKIQVSLPRDMNRKFENCTTDLI